MPVLDIDRVETDCPAALAGYARHLVRDGARGDTVLSRSDRRLPPKLLAALRATVTRPDPETGYLVVSGLLRPLVDDQGPTPLHWRDADRARTATLDVALVLVASALGRVFGWVNQQDGALVHNIVPSPGHEQMQVGASSVTPLMWHTEDAFHPRRADLLLLACVRNPDGIGSRLATARRRRISAADQAQLGRPLLSIRPDESYLEPTVPAPEPVGMATVWQRSGGLGLRYDPSYSMMLTDDPAFHDAYARLGRALDGSGLVIPLEAGDLLIIDNDATVHGRQAFRARYDGTDRWLKRVLVRSAPRRPALEDREHGYAQVQVDATAG